MASADSREARLGELHRRIQQCRQCDLERTRTNIVFGSGNPESKLMFVGEAPGYHEDQQGLPFIGRAGTLLEKLLSRIELTRNEVYIANVLKCRPPDNRDPQIDEIQLCRVFLEEQISIIQPLVICTLGNFATKLLSGRPDGISRVHGQAQELSGHRGTHLFPVYHPAAALYTPANLKALEVDFDRLPALLGKTKTKPLVESEVPKADVTVESGEGQPEPEQLGLF